MISKKAVLKNSSGLHLRPASDFVKAMSKYKSEVSVIFGDNIIDGKSILNLMAACIKRGSEIELRCTGEDEEAMMNEAICMIDSCFGESEQKCGEQNHEI